MKILERYNVSLLIKAIRLMGNRGRIYVLLIFLFNIVEAIGVPLYAYGIKGVIKGISSGDIGLFTQSLILIAINRVSWILYAPVCSYLCGWASKKAMVEIKSGLTEHLMQLPPKYHDNRPTGELLSLLSNDIACLASIYDYNYFELIRCAVIGIIGLITMLVIDWRFAAVVLCFGTSSVYASSYFSERLKKTSSSLAAKLAQNSTDFYEMIKAAKTYRLLGIGAMKMKSFDHAAKSEEDIRVQTSNMNSKMSGVISFINTFSYVLILIIGGVFVYYKLLDWGVVVSLAGLKETTDCLFSECGMHMASMQKTWQGHPALLWL